uniref:Uncharacterized protein n=1 Tax=Plectus sambesii TaxID=2011161 RepID=A0A914VE35_9BILA
MPNPFGAYLVVQWQTRPAYLVNRLSNGTNARTDGGDCVKDTLTEIEVADTNRETETVLACAPVSGRTDFTGWHRMDRCALNRSISVVRYNCSLFAAAAAAYSSSQCETAQLGANDRVTLRVCLGSNVPSKDLRRDRSGCLHFRHQRALLFCYLKAKTCLIWAEMGGLSNHRSGK